MIYICIYKEKQVIKKQGYKKQRKETLKIQRYKKIKLKSAETKSQQDTNKNKKHESKQTKN